MKMKALEYDPDEGDGADAWSEEQLELIFHRKELQAQLTGDPVLKLMRLKLIGNLRGLITAPSEPKDKLEAVKLLLHVLKEAGFTTGAFDANKLFDMELGTIVKAIEGLVDKLAALVGMSPPANAEAAPVPPSNWPRYHFTAPIPGITMPVKPEAVRTPRSGSTQYASATSDAGSDGSNSSIGLSRMTLGPSGSSNLVFCRLRIRLNVYKRNST
jgi:hypothetical protein